MQLFTAHQRCGHEEKVTEESLSVLERRNITNVVWTRRKISHVASEEVTSAWRKFYRGPLRRPRMRWEDAEDSGRIGKTNRKSKLKQTGAKFLGGGLKKNQRTDKIITKNRMSRKGVETEGGYRNRFSNIRCDDESKNRNRIYLTCSAAIKNNCPVVRVKWDGCKHK
ncbi:Hypothetical protein CINCED_3A002435 [Cinara cedri]|uniref:Uncharacterized protein n=1 Tax=Cinara cedri TaxID=506608 RepID=A0A5E4LXB6_9HEMI|nr:Hypothetical protein CINCED_3A002435 [Cinara cedri]